MEQLVSRLACTVRCLPACHTSCESSKRPTELLTSVICVAIFQLRSPWLWHDDRCERPHRLRLGFHGSAGAHTCPRCPRAAHRRTWRGHCCVALSYRIQGGAGPAAPWLLRPGVPLAHRASTAPSPRQHRADARPVRRSESRSPFLCPFALARLWLHVRCGQRNLPSELDGPRCAQPDAREASTFRRRPRQRDYREVEFFRNNICKWLCCCRSA